MSGQAPGKVERPCLPTVDLEFIIHSRFCRGRKSDATITLTMLLSSIGGMAGSNSIGGHSLRCGTIRDYVIGIDLHDHLDGTLSSANTTMLGSVTNSQKGAQRGVGVHDSFGALMLVRTRMSIDPFSKKYLSVIASLIGHRERLSAGTASGGASSKYDRNPQAS